MFCVVFHAGSDFGPKIIPSQTYEKAIFLRFCKFRPRVKRHQEKKQRHIAWSCQRAHVCLLGCLPPCLCAFPPSCLPTFICVFLFGTFVDRTVGLGSISYWPVLVPTVRFSSQGSSRRSLGARGIASGAPLIFFLFNSVKTIKHHLKFV